MELKLVVLLALFNLSTLSFIQASSEGFSVDLIHRDSPKSPFYNPLDTHYDRLRNAITRSIARTNYYRASSISPNEPEARVQPDNGEYLMSVSLGTPPVEILAIADTGSDVLWTQCYPCEQCYDQVAPLFDPKESSTYRDLSCDSTPCQALSSTSCRNGACLYSLQYGDRSYSQGNLASETLTIGAPNNRSVALPKTLFGCGHKNDGTFSPNGTGIVGLGGGPLSLITQLGSKIKGKFSYCLVPFSSDSSSKLNFGSNAVVSGSGVVSTPIVPNSPDTFYYLTLEGITVGEKKLAYKGQSKTNAFGTEEGNIIIDSGTTLTLLPSELYDEFETSLKQAISLEPIVSPPSGLKLCYDVSSDSDVEAPKVTLHFTEANVVLQPLNTFIKVEEGTVCLAMVPSEDLAIFGNIAQINFHIGYDIQGGQLSFQPTDCTRH